MNRNIKASFSHMTTEGGPLKSVPTSDMDFDFLKEKVEELLLDAITCAILFSEKIIKKGDTDKFEEMPTTKLKIGLSALMNKDKEKFGQIVNEFLNNGIKCQTKYREKYVLVYGPLNEINRAVGNFGNFRSVLTYPVLTSAKPDGEVMLPRKDGTLVEEINYLEDAEEVKRITQEAIYEVTKKIMSGPFGEALDSN